MTTPDADRWRRLSGLFERALDLDPAARAVLVEGECADDPQMRAELERMLAADSIPHAFDQGAAGAVTQESDEARGPDEDERESVGTRLGHWMLERMLGRGGMGTVYAARRDDRDTLQRAAVKRLHRRWDGSLQAQRFLQERRILAALSHPNIPRLLDHGLDDDGRPWFALELVEGKPLTAWADERRLDLRERLDLFRTLCTAVQHAHEHFVVHRDLKPANILVDDEGHPRVLDFGIAKRIDDAPGATRTGMFVGFTPDYAAPEQINGGPISAATDVYALGVVLYQLLAGRLPYRLDHDDLRATTEAITARSADRLDQAITTGTAQEVDTRLAQRGTDLRAFRRFVKGDLSRIVQTALAKEPQRRYASVQAFSSDLERFLAGRTVSVSGDTSGYRTRKFVRRNATAVSVAMALLLALMGTTAWALYNASEERQQRDAALAEVGRSNAIREYIQLMFRTAAEKSVAETPTAQDVLQQGAERLFTQFDTQPEAARPVAIMLAELYMEMGDWEGATPLLEQVLASPGIIGDTDTQAKAQGYLGQAAYARGDAKQARAMLQQAQATWAKQPHRYAAALNESRISQAKLERSEGHPEQAIATLRAMIAARPALVDKPDRELAVAQSTLAAFLLDAGAYEHAELQARRAIAVFEGLGMGRSSQGIVAMNNLAASLTQRDRSAEAEPILRHLVQLYRELYGHSSTNLALMQANLADSLRRQNRVEEAIPLLEEALPIALKTSGDRSQATLYITLALAESYLDVGRTPDAALLEERSFSIVLKDLGPKHRLAGVAYRVRAGVRAAHGDRAGAAADYDAAARVFGALGPGGAGLLAKLKERRAKSNL
jgi:eukaryotic-like serine/threonine-protein kinase